jgi:hypothetical protein
VKPADAGAGAQDKAAAKHGAVECFFVIKKEKMKAMRDCGQDATLAPGVGVVCVSTQNLTFFRKV